MNMEANLYVMLGECLIIPYSEDVAERLEELCDEYAEEQDLDDDKVADMAISLFAKTRNEELKQFLETKYSEKFEESISLPSCTINALMAFLICRAIDGKYENADSDFCSMSLMNCVILLNGRYASMPYAEYFVERFGKLQNYIKQESDKLRIESDDFAKMLFKSSDPFTEEISEDKIAACKKMAWESWKYNVMRILENTYSKKVCSYADVFHVLNEVISKMPYEYLSLDLGYVLDNLLRKDSNEEKTIADIVKELEENGCTVIESKCKSSILLRLLNHDVDFAKLPFATTSLSKHDFGVYLYFELLMEKIAGNYGTEE